ncbi:MAG: cytosine permease [Candidatus Methanomethylicaceae archaeon]
MKTYSDSAIYPVEPKDRVFSGIDLGLLWAGSAIVVDVWYSGGYLYPIGWIPGISLIILGSFVGSLIFAAAGVIGSDLGIPSMVTVRASFGLRGSYLMSVLNYVTLIGWTAWMLFINASAADQIGSMLFGFTGFPFWVLIGGIICIALAIFGAEGWKIFNRASVTALIVTALAINYFVFANYGWGHLVSQPSWGMPPGIAFDLALIMPLSWAPLAADYMRFAKSSKGGFLGSLIGQGSVNSWFYITGLACALAFGMYDPTIYVTQMGGAVFGIIALFVIWFGTITTTFLDIYSANMSIINIFPKVKEWQGSVVTGLVGIIIAFLPWLEAFVQFLYLIGAVFVPLFAIVVADYFILRRRRYKIQDLYEKMGGYWFRGGVSVIAISAWLMGVIVYYWVQQFLPDLGATLPSFIITSIMYWIMRRILGDL